MPAAPPRPRLLLLLLFLPLTACIEDHLSVELVTQVHADGTCTRRVEYVFERTDPQRPDRRFAFTRDDSPLRMLHRFPSGEEWRWDEEIRDGYHRIVLDATLSSPNDFDGDFFRARHPRTPPARNFVSAYTDPEQGVFEYYEVLRDPVSPLAVARALARDVVARDREFSRHVLAALGERSGVPQEDQLRGRYLELFAQPFAEDLAKLRRRPIFGPRERRVLDAVLEDVERRQDDLRRSVRAVAPAVPVDDLDAAVDAAMDVLGEEAVTGVEESDLLLLADGQGTRLTFRATVVLPHPIRRSNTCAAGDTAVWEFDGSELYGRGFEMMALASAP